MSDSLITLTRKQKRELEKLKKKFQSVMSVKPGKTTLAEHKIVTGSAKPIYTPAYPSKAYQETLKEEIREMLDNGITQASCSVSPKERWHKETVCRFLSQQFTPFHKWTTS